MSPNSVSVSVKKKQFPHAVWEKIVTRYTSLLIPIAFPPVLGLPAYAYSYKLKSSFR